MLTLEQLRALRGIATGNSAMPAENQNAPASVQQNTDNVGAFSALQQTPQQQQNAASQAQPKLPDPIEIPCKNYNDEQGHFAYIDAYTHEITHVNLDTGKTYTQDEVKALSLKHATAVLSDDAKRLSWQQVITSNTLFDQFGSPSFTFEEIQNALNKLRQNNAAYSYAQPQPVQTSTLDASAENKPKTDPFGFPL